MTMPLLLLTCALAQPQRIPLADFAAVVIADRAPVAEQTAAKELADYVQRSAGVTLPVLEAAQAPTGKPLFLVGDSAARRKLAPDVKLDTLGPDGIVLATVGRNVVLAGSPPRGTLYAVYTFLEDTLGVRWWTSSEETVPKRTDVTVPPLSVHYTPKLRYREAFYRDALEGTFAARSKCNGHFAGTPAERGGHMSIIGWCHTFYQFMPPERYFAEHPDWYSEHDGKRTADGGQLCCSSAGAREEMKKQVLARLRENPTAGIISVSQNDWGGWCDCPACHALVEREGSQAGPLLEFVNDVADAVAKEFPDALVETLAYQASRKPPRTVKPRPNVVVRLCSIECDFSTPLATGPRNKSFAADIAGWKAMAPRLFIWNYVTNFANYLIPHANLTALAPDLRFFVDSGTVGLFEQGDTGSGTGDFVRLRAWLLAHLMWDPSRDERALTTQFLTGYYGAAAAPLQAYLDLREAAAAKANVHFGCYRGNTADWLKLADLTECSRLFDAAEKAVADQPALLARVRRERLPLTLSWLLSDRALRAEAKAKGIPYAGPADGANASAEWRDASVANNVGQYAEGRPFEGFGQALVDRFRRGAPPKEAAGLANDDWVDWQDGACVLHGLGNWVTRVDDPAASDRKAARMPASHNQWAVQCPVGDELSGERWHIYVSLRGIAKAKTGTACTVGLYDGPGGKDLAQVTLKVEDLVANGYQTVDLGAHPITSGVYAWVAPANNPDAMEAVLVDRVFAVRAKP